ncbi:hypothetical protein F444_00657 [Phytophthora nicotianae P1976]|uniref:Uncharacterized protein n=1 Tax=Phytophthora nicotianae P1976 TaxID=1317066 RepID=A0A081B3J6_PHYNI|nr:hypothetical protein F444_00657 [Phytophthora nicotianae P1976]
MGSLRTTSTQCRSAHELGSLQVEYELTLKQTGTVCVTAQELGNQVKEMERMSRSCNAFWGGFAKSSRNSTTNLLSLPRAPTNSAQDDVFENCQLDKEADREKKR